MNYSIVKTGGKQYRAEKGTVLRVEKLDAEQGKEVSLEVVCGLKTVKARVDKHDRDEKIDGFKYKAKKNQRTRWGHRQPYTQVTITEVK